jgi:hypothetical protein
MPPVDTDSLDALQLAMPGMINLHSNMTGAAMGKANL